METSKKFPSITASKTLKIPCICTNNNFDSPNITLIHQLATIGKKHTPYIQIPIKKLTARININTRGVILIFETHQRQRKLLFSTEMTHLPTSKISQGNHTTRLLLRIPTLVVTTVNTWTVQKQIQSFNISLQWCLNLHSLSSHVLGLHLKSEFICTISISILLEHGRLEVDNQVV